MLRNMYWTIRSQCTLTLAHENIRKSYGFLVLFLSVEKGWLRTNGLMLLEKSKSKKIPRLISTSNRMPSSAINNKFDECN